MILNKRTIYHKNVSSPGIPGTGKRINYGSEKELFRATVEETKAGIMISFS
jgi:hypothetical protein